MSGIVLFGDWKKAELRLASLKKTIAIKFRIFIRKEAELLRGLIIEGFNKSGHDRWKPLSPWTLAMRRFKGFAGTKPLIHTGEMRKSITTKMSKGGLVGFVGILYKSKNQDGDRLVNIAKVHEFGVGPYAVKMTDKMRKFLFMVGTKEGIIKNDKKTAKKQASSTMIITIPARPFLVPAFKIWKKGLPVRIQRFLKVGI